MPNDRAAVAREVLTDMAKGLEARGFTVIVDITESWRDEHYPAPPAPETVAVDVYGTPVTFRRSADAWLITSAGGGLIPHARRIADAKLDRIASDARVIPELERSRDVWDAEARSEAGNFLYWRGERDRAIEAIKERDARIAELEKALEEQPSKLYDSMWQAIDRMGDAVGALTGPGSNCHVTARRVCETIETLKSERDAANARIAELETQLQRALDGAVFHEKRAHHAEQERDAALRALEASKHPVATRETVERVAKAIDNADSDSLCPVWDAMTVHQKSVLCDMARAALTAAGFTLEAGA